MFVIESILSPRWTTDIGSLDIEDITYRAFLGSVRLCCDSVKINFDYEWIPLMEFAAAMMNIVNRLEGGTDDRAIYRFTESDEKIQFELEDQIIRITPSASKQIMEVAIDQFREGVIKNYVTLVADLLARYPALKNNRDFQELISVTEKCLKT